MIEISIERAVRISAVRIAHRKRHVARTRELHLVACKGIHLVRHVEETEPRMRPVGIRSSDSRIGLVGVKELLDILVDLHINLFRSFHRSERNERNVVEALRSRYRECLEGGPVTFVFLRRTAFIDGRILSRGIPHHERMNVRGLHLGAARSADLVAVAVVPSQELLSALRNRLEHDGHTLRIVGIYRCRFGGSLGAYLDSHLVHGRHVVTEFFHHRIGMRTHLFGNDTPESVRTVHLQVDLVRLVLT